MTMNKCVFLDRDGVIIRDYGYVSSVNEVELNKNVGQCIRLLNECGFIVIIVTNQSGVARGFFGEDVVNKINQHISKLLLMEDAYIQKFYVCPHYENGIVKKYSIACNCRKPNQGMLLQAKKEYDIDFQHSYLIGDKPSDVHAGERAGVKQSFLVERDGDILQIVERILYSEVLLSHEKRNELIERIKDCFEQKDSQKWEELLYNDDDMTVTAEKEWFEVYVRKACDLRIKLTCKEELGKISIRNQLTLFFESYESHNEIHEYFLEYVESQNAWKIVKIQKERSEFPISYEQYQDVELIKLDSSKCPWWDNQKLLEIEQQCMEPDSENIYLRSIARTVLYRGAHPIIECASIKVNIISVYIASLVKKLYNKEKLHYLANVYNAVKDKFTVSIARSERNNEWSSKLQAPWYTFDELMSLKLVNGKIIGSCSSYMSFFYAMLKLGGYKQNDLIQARFNTQDILLVFIDPDIYMISTDSIQKLTEKTLFFKKDITILFTDEWYWTERGETNTDEETRAKIIEKFKPINKVFFFPFECKENIGSVTAEAEEHCIDMQCDSVTLHNDTVLNNYIDSLSHSKGASTWGKYAYQSLIVQKPNVYVKWSLQCKLVREFVMRMDCLQDIMNYFAQLKEGSIFFDDYRIMTADQVIRCNQADNKAKAIFFYTIMKLKYNFMGGVIFTAKQCYCMWKNGEKIIFMDMSSMEQKDLIRDKVLLAMNEKKVVYPLLHAEDEAKSYLELLGN